MSTGETISSRFVAGIIATLGECVATAEPTTEQTGQKCVAEAAADRSVQKWSCAPQEDDPEEQRQNANALRLSLHVITKTKPRQKWL